MEWVYAEDLKPGMRLGLMGVEVLAVEREGDWVDVQFRGVKKPQRFRIEQKFNLYEKPVLKPKARKPQAPPVPITQAEPANTLIAPDPSPAPVMASKPVGEMSVAEAGRLGGKKRLAQIGREGFVALGKTAGATTLSKHGSEHYSRIGKLGGEALKAKPNSQQHYAEIGRKGAIRMRELLQAGKAAEANDEGGEG